MLSGSSGRAAVVILLGEDVGDEPVVHVSLDSQIKRLNVHLDAVPYGRLGRRRRPQRGDPDQRSGGTRRSMIIRGERVGSSGLFGVCLAFVWDRPGARVPPGEDGLPRAPLIRPRPVGPRALNLGRGHVERELVATQVRHAAAVHVSFAPERQALYPRHQKRPARRAKRPPKGIHREGQLDGGSAAGGSDQSLRRGDRVVHLALGVLDAPRESPRPPDARVSVENFRRRRRRLCRSRSFRNFGSPAVCERRAAGGEDFGERNVHRRARRRPPGDAERRERPRDDRRGRALLSLDQRSPLDG
mmetsp:Transcript_4143/g.16998  ORF Transcript_4143/g.16998 Transcript_4143/m.16998 type:complete len:301 (-) Transcript_4143:2660-3562(-)